MYRVSCCWSQGQTSGHNKQTFFLTSIKHREMNQKIAGCLFVCVCVCARVLHCAGGASSIISSFAASFAGYMRKTSLRGTAPPSCSGVSMAAAASAAKAQMAPPGGGAPYINLHSTAVTAAAAAEKLQQVSLADCNAASVVSSRRGSTDGGSSDTSSNFGADFLPGALGVAFIPITLVFNDLR